MKTLLNVVLFQALWLITVAGAGRGYWWAGLPMLAVFVTLHFGFLTPWRRADAILLLASVMLGGVCDSVLAMADVLRFEQPIPSPSFAPVWILVLWAGFALTLNHSMSFFQRKPWYAALFGLIGGPLAYAVAAHVWKAVQFGQANWIVYSALAIVWAVMTPLLLEIGFTLRTNAAADAKR
jgi:hypothetical protein